MIISFKLWRENKLLNELDGRTKEYKYVGTCVNSFEVTDGDCYCHIPQLPYRDVTDFAQDEEDAVEISRDVFFALINTNENLLKKINNKNVIYLRSKKDVLMAFDTKRDVHYFFVK